MQTLATISVPEKRTGVHNLIPLSVRYDIINKQHEGANLSTNWTHAEMDMLELARHVSSGYAISISTFEGNYRKQANVLETRLIGLDFDKGTITAEQAREHEVIGRYAGIIAPTASDTPECPRVRALIPLSRSVTNTELKRMGHIFAALLPEQELDTSVFDAARLFFGSQPPKSRVFVNPDACLDVDSFLSEHA